MRNNHACLLFAVLLLLSSCHVNHYLYAPSVPQAPMLNSKGEMNITGMVSVGATGHSTADSGYNYGFDLQAAYALSDHLAITASFARRNEKDVYESGTLYSSYPANLWYRRNTMELGLGYFTSIDSDDEVFFDLYGGYGFGKYRLRENDRPAGGSTLQTHTTSIAKFYLQPGFHFNVSDMSQAGLSLRFTAANYYHIMSDYTAEQEKSYHMATIRNTTFVYLEPSLAVRLWVPHSPWIKFQTELSTSIKLNNEAFHYRKSYVSFGLSFDLSKLNDISNYKRKNKNNNRPAPPVQRF